MNNIKPITEHKVEKAIRNYLSGKGWELTNLPKGPGEHGIDIKAIHKKWRKLYKIECKGDSKDKINQQKIHDSFNRILGQILSRMDKEGKNTNNNKAIIYAIGIPKHWENIFKNKISKMKFGWKLLKLKIFFVENEIDVTEVGYTYFLK